MKLKVVLNGREKIRSFVSSVQMLTKHSDHITFVFNSDKLTILVERPVIWTDINIVNFADEYEFEGELVDDVQSDCIYIDIKSKNSLFPLTSLITSDNSTVEISLIKHAETPFLRMHSKRAANLLKGSFELQIPIIMIPQDQWDSINVPRDLNFDMTCKLPRYSIFCKFVDLFKHSKSICCYLYSYKFVLESGTIIENRFISSFRNTKSKKDPEYDQERACLFVDSKKLSGFFHSLSAFNMSNVAIKGRIKNISYMQIDFQIENGLIRICTVLENSEYIDESVAITCEEYQDNLKMLSSE